MNATVKHIEADDALDTLVIVHRYPDKDNLYEYAFVHSRVKAYRAAGLKVKVFRIDGKSDEVREYEFEGASVICGGLKALSTFVSAHQIRTLSAHLLTKEMWHAIEPFATNIRVNVWLHGSEIQDWLRRHFVIESKEQRISSIRRYRSYYEFWKKLLGKNDYNLHFIFVSQYLADEIMDDMEVVVNPEKYSIIHNFVDTKLFSYKKKPIEQRTKILSIRPFESTKYANDLTVKAIQSLSKEPFFDELHFTIVGEGRLFEELTRPISKLANVKLTNRFVTQFEIAELHKQNGVFLVPTRMDTQGVSRDEAMSSGLVPVTSNNTAIPEFVSDKEGFKTDTEDHLGLASSIKTIYEHPDLFSSMSQASGARVRRQSDFSHTIQKEIDLIKGAIGRHGGSNYGLDVFKDFSTDRERILRNALFDVIDEQEADYKRRTAWHWRKINNLVSEVHELTSSASYRAGLAFTYPLRKIYHRSIIGRPLRGIHTIVHSDKKLVMIDKKLTHGEVFTPPKQKKFYTSKRPKSIKMAVIMDEFTHGSFSYECNVLQLTPHSWRDELETFQPDMLFVESAWRGKDDLWIGKVHTCSRELKDIVEYCKEASIPTAFWNKEDPVHTVTYMRAASLFDRVFTTDIEAIPNYRDVLGHNRIYLLPFAAQPKINNPIELYSRQDKFNFAGSYYRNYKERCRDFAAVVNAVTKIKDLDIYDRNYDNDIKVFEFEDEYKPYIVGKLPYSEISKAYKGYRYAITMNTIKYSPTMFARRAFELLASNTITVGNRSDGIQNILGDLTTSSDNTKEILERLKTITSTVENENKYKLLGLRKVMEEHTYKERLSRILTKVFSGYKDLETDANNGVAVIAVVDNLNDAKSVFNSYRLQRYSQKRLIIISDNENIQIPKDIKGVLITSKDNARKKMQSVINLDGRVAVFKPTNYYGENYLGDIMIATSYSDAEAIGKSTYYSLDKKGALRLSNKNRQYLQDEPIAIDSGIVSANLVSKLSLSRFVKDIASNKLFKENTLSLDEFSFCRGKDLTAEQQKDVDGLLGIDMGVDIKELYKAADAVSDNKIQSLKSSWLKKARLVRTMPPQKPL